MAVATLTASLVVSGCTTWSTTGPDQATLDGTVLAVYYSPQTYTWGEPGHVLLVDRTGRSTALQTSGMDVASLVWTNAGLYGEPLLTQQSFTFPVASTTLSRSGELIWMSEDGTVRSTDPATGVSRALWSTGRTLGGSGDTAVRFEDGSLFLLERVAGGNDLVLSRYGTESGEGGVVLTVPGVGGRESLRQVRRDFAVAPEWAAGA